MYQLSQDLILFLPLEVFLALLEATAGFEHASNHQLQPGIDFHLFFIKITDLNRYRNICG